MGSSEPAEIGDIGTQPSNHGAGMGPQRRGHLDQPRFWHVAGNADQFEHQQGCGLGTEAFTQYLDIAIAIGGRAQRLESHRNREEKPALVAHQPFDHANHVMERGEIEFLECRHIVFQKESGRRAPHTARPLRQHRRAKIGGNDAARRIPARPVGIAELGEGIADPRR
jgi:hypothetical protein